MTSGACREKPGFTLGRRLLANRFLLLAAGCLQRPTPPVGERTSECVFASCLQAVVVGGVQRSCRPGTPAPPPGGLPDFDCCTHCTTSRHPARHTARRKKNCQAWLITAVNIPLMHAWTNWHTRVAPRLVEMHQTFWFIPRAPRHSSRVLKPASCPKAGGLAAGGRQPTRTAYKPGRCYDSNNDWIARAKEIHTWFRPELVCWRSGSNIGKLPRCVRGWKIGGRNAQSIPKLVLMCAYAYRGDAEIM